MPYVYSTLAATVTYENTEVPTEANPIPRVLSSVTVKGGANVIDSKFNTEKAFRTEVTEEQLEHLKANAVFKAHVADGYVMYDDTKANAEKVAKENLKARDVSAPKTPEDYENAKLKPIVNSDKKSK